MKNCVNGKFKVKRKIYFVKEAIALKILIIAPIEKDYYKK